ncbi:MAG: hypothetical protein ABIM21_04980 [candidate division WOR-3 bacterium]
MERTRFKKDQQSLPVDRAGWRFVDKEAMITLQSLATPTMTDA